MPNDTDGRPLRVGDLVVVLADAETVRLCYAELEQFKIYQVLDKSPISVSLTPDRGWIYSNCVRKVEPGDGTR